MARHFKHPSNGFTLIETLLYIALFAIIIGGGLIAVFQIIQSTDANRNQAILQEEANFLLRKVDWALTGATAITTPPNTTPTTTLVVNKIIGGSSTVLTFGINANDPVCPANYICLKRGTGASQLNTNLYPLNSTSISISGLSFQRSVPVSGKPDAVTTSFTLITVQNGRTSTQAFSTTKYLRK